LSFQLCRDLVPHTHQLPPSVPHPLLSRLHRLCRQQSADRRTVCVHPESGYEILVRTRVPSPCVRRRKTALPARRYVSPLSTYTEAPPGRFPSLSAASPGRCPAPP